MDRGKQISLKGTHTETVQGCRLQSERFISRGGKVMDKQAKAFADLMKQAIPESPLKEAFRKWNETTKIIKEQNEK